MGARSAPPQAGTDVLVVGAGAAGLAAAAEAALAGARVLLLEKNERPGLKILISGGGHCNVATTLAPREAEPLFGPSGGRFLRVALRTTSPDIIRGWLEERGVRTIEREFEKVWPASMRARDVLDALIGRARDAGVELRTRHPVSGLARARDGHGWQVVGPFGTLAASSLVLAVGGQSYPRTGTVGEGYAWLGGLGLRLTERVPGLAPLSSDASWVHALAGITLSGVEVQLRERGGRVVMRRRRPLLFTHTGISGPGVMDVSSRVAREPARFRVCIDLCPDRTEEALRTVLFTGGGRLAAALQREAGLPRRVAATILGLLGLQDCPPAQVAARRRRELVQALKGLEIPVTGTLGFAKAEVTAGGLALDQVEPRSMEVRDLPGLFVTGELLDVDGPIGGFSFWIAFATGVLAGRAAAARAAQP